MRSKLYLLTALMMITLVIQAQKYNVALSEEWNNNAWTNTSKSTFTYDASGNILSTTTETWDNGAWLNAARMVNTLNADGTVKETLTQSWQDGDWQDAMKTVFTYNATKKVLTQTTQMSLGEGLPPMDFSKLTYTYNEQDQLTDQLLQTVNFATMQLVNSEQNHYTYNTDGTENQMVTQNWGLTNEWENTTRNTNTYNASKQVVSDLNEIWENNTWVNDYSASYSYHSGGQLEESEGKDWINGKWENSFKELFTYNNQNEISQVVSQEWNTAQSKWDDKSRITYSYDATGFDPLELTGNSLTVFPNPFADQITVQSKLTTEQTIEVFNADGQLVYSVKMLTDNFKVYLGELEKGIYLLKSNKNNQSIKLLKTQ